MRLSNPQAHRLQPMPRRLLSLPEWKIHKIRENDHDILVHATPPRPDACQRCGVVGAHLHKVGNSPCWSWMFPSGASAWASASIEIAINVRSATKGSTIAHANSINSPKNKKKKTADGKRDETSQQHKITLALREWIWDQSLRRNFHDVAYDVGLHDRTVRKIFRAEFQRRERMSPRPVPRWVGIDEVNLLSWKRSDKTPRNVRKPQCILTDLETGVVYDLLRNRDLDTVLAALYRMKAAGEAPRGFSMDMYNNYRAAVREVFPQAEIVVNKFHVTQQIDSAFSRVRTKLQAEMTRRRRTSGRWAVSRSTKPCSSRGALET